jgi:hypothetical protein
MTGSTLRAVPTMFGSTANSIRIEPRPVPPAAQGAAANHQPGADDGEEACRVEDEAPLAHGRGVEQLLLRIELRQRDLDIRVSVPGVSLRSTTPLIVAAEAAPGEEE